MNGRRAMANELCTKIVEEIQNLENIDVALCPPFILLNEVQKMIADNNCMLGAQDLDMHDDGAYTGQVSAEMLKDAGCEWVIIGHSERRTLFGETNLIVSKKVKQALNHGLNPILCVGETEDERKAGQEKTVVQEQLQSVIDEIGIESCKNIAIAYEPVWAIGTGLTATSDEAQTIHSFIREQISSLDDEVANSCRILYGGSMKKNNASSLLVCPDIDGGLIGGASLSADEFLGICRSV
ncbi:MAG: triose-phosphate isomerase [Gammaproteobacteria bacterium]|nr:triose-phosphate isomerase [Gammaproteobacteria bacterium]MCY4217684.1 triose-phosphate isomerase [Gammaproteobacteria bacterium]MCY4275636.1 triose-phosphate isomerase [Gammaproteobacteria bacterium]